MPQRIVALFVVAAVAALSSGCLIHSEQADTFSPEPGSYLHQMTQGSIRIASEPTGATVWELASEDAIEGIEIGTTPLLRKAYAPGRSYYFLLEWPGYHGYTLIVRPTPQHEHVQANVKLLPDLRQLGTEERAPGPRPFDTAPERRNLGGVGTWAAENGLD